MWRTSIRLGCWGGTTKTFAWISTILAGLLFPVLPGSGQPLREDLWDTNDHVRSIVQTPDAIYIGGNFTQVGPATGSAVAIDLTTGAAQSPYPSVSGAVNAATSDGNGGWYIGGSFTAVGGQLRYGLAHVDSSGVLSSWGPELVNPSEQVRCLYLSGSTLYVGGTFTNLGGQARSHLAAVDVPSGTVTSWNPAPNQPVYSLAVVFGTVYAGGQFTQIGGTSRNLVAALDPTTGTATAWNPNVTGSIVRAVTARVVVLPSTTVTIYIGGSFTLVGGQGRSNIASIDATGGGTGTVTSWNPGVTGTVFAMNVNGPYLIAGGSFTVAGGAARRNLVSINGSGVATSWDPSPDQTVNVLTRTGSTLYAGGDFTIVGGQPRQKIAAIDLVSGTTTAWDPKAGGRVNALALFGTEILAGGEFAIMGGVDRTYLASLDPITGEATDWNPYLNGAVVSMDIRGTTLYAAGFFQLTDAGLRSCLAAYDMTTGHVTSWNPDANNPAYGVTVADSVVYVAGLFSHVGGADRYGLAAVDTVTGLATDWYPVIDPNYNIWYRAAVGASTVYAGSDYGAFGFDRTSGQLVWDSNANGVVWVCRAVGGRIYLAGSFSQAGGQPRGSAASFYDSNGLVTDWNPAIINGPNKGQVYSMAFGPGAVYVGGSFETVGGQSRKNLAAVDALTGAALEWNPAPTGGVEALDASNGNLLAGGALDEISGRPRDSFAGFSVESVGVESVSSVAPRVPVAASPNPSRGLAGLRFSLAADDEVDVTVVDLSGRLVRRVWSGPLPAGEQNVTWDGRDETGKPVSSGVYFARVRGRTVSGGAKILRL